MSLQQKLARYQAEKPGLVVAAEGALTAARLVDLHAQARAAQAPITVLHEGAPTEVARRMAARFGITLVDAATLADSPLEIAPPAILPSAPAPIAIEVPLAETVPAPAPPLSPLAVRPPRLARVAVRYSAPIVAPPALPPAAPEPLLPAHVEVSVPVVVAPPEPLCVGLPWDPASPRELSSVTIEVSAAELAALPWHAHAPLEEHTEIIESPVTRRRAPLDHPTTDLHPHGASWGLPWPRPVPPMDAVSKSDPAVWNMPGRIQAVRDDLEQRISPAPKLDASWLKRLQG